MADADDQNSLEDPLLENPTGGEAEEINSDAAPPPSNGGDDATADPTGAAEAPTAWEKGITIKDHLAALKAQHDAQLETATLRERIKRLEVEKQLAEARAQLVTNSSSSPSSVTQGEPASRADRRAQEKEWDALSYVPVEKYGGNPFRGPDPGVHLPNARRPQCFPLDHDPVHKLLAEAKSGMKFEYEITQPILHYYWALKQFLESDFAQCILSDESTAEQRTDYLEALINSNARIFEWLAIRHALITKRARTPKSEQSSSILEHYQNEVYAFVGSAPPTSAWLDSIETAFQDKVFVAELKNLAQVTAKKKGGASGSESGGSGAGGKGKIPYKKGKGGIPPLAEAGKGGGGEKK
jgi:hypothetical protein